MTTKKSDSKKGRSKNFRAQLSPGERAKAKVKVPKVRKERRDKYRSFSVTKKENESMPARAKAAGFADVAVWLRFVSLGVRD